MTQLGPTHYVTVDGVDFESMRSLNVDGSLFALVSLPHAKHLARIVDAYPRLVDALKHEATRSRRRGIVAHCESLLRELGEL